LLKTNCQLVISQQLSVWSYYTNELSYISQAHQNTLKTSSPTQNPLRTEYILQENHQYSLMKQKDVTDFPKWGNPRVTKTFFNKNA
jgi:hypothetical protein